MLLLCLALAGSGGALAQEPAAGPADPPAPSRRERLEARVAAATTPSPAFQQWINDGIGRTTETVEQTRRTLRDCRSPVLLPQVATGMQPALVALIDAMAPYAVRQRHAPGSEPSLLRAMGLALAMAGYTDADLEALVQVLESPAAVRARRAVEPLLALQAMAQSRTDIGTGLAWQWPLQPLRGFMEALGKTRDFDAALEEAQPGAAAWVRQPNGHIDQALPADMARQIDGLDWGKVGEAFEKRLAPQDLDGLSDPAIGQFFEVQSRAEAATADLLSAPADNRLPPQELLPEARGRRACRTMGIALCPDAALRQVLDLREQVLAAHDYQNFRRRLEGMPASGCPPLRP